MKKILFIIEKHIIHDSGKATNNYSGDTSLIFAAMQKAGKNSRIFLANPNLEIKENKLIVREIFLNNLAELTKEKAAGYLSAALDYLTGRPIEKHFSQFLLSDELSIDCQELTEIHNRAEPISLTDQFYQRLITIFAVQLEQNKIFNDPRICHKINDKQSIYDLDQTLNDKEKLGFDTMILEADDLNKLNNEELEKFQKNLPLCIKPYNWSGGIGVILHNDKLTVQKLIQYLSEIKQEILQDAKKSNNDEAIKLAVLSKIILQEQARYPHFGDLRILISKGKILGGFLRVPKTGQNIGNLHFGGHPEPIPSIALYGNDLEKITKELKENKVKFILPNLDVIDAAAFVDCLHNLENNLQKILARANAISGELSSLFYIGVDGLLHSRGNQLQFCVNEMNVTCPMGQAQFDMAKLALNMLENHDFSTIIYDLIKEFSADLITKEKFIWLHPYVKYAIIKQSLSQAINAGVNEEELKQNLKNNLSKNIGLKSFETRALDIINNEAISLKILENI